MWDISTDREKSSHYFGSLIVFRRYHLFTYGAANHCCQSLNEYVFIHHKLFFLFEMSIMHSIT